MIRSVLPDGLHWNILELYRNLLVGLRKAVSAQPDLAGVGIDSWAVDYGLVSGNRLINNPFHYRDERTARGVELVHKIADHATLYADEWPAVPAVQFDLPASCRSRNRRHR